MARTIGFIGLGIMESAMARRLVDAGHRVTVTNRDLRKAGGGGLMIPIGRLH